MNTGTAILITVLVIGSLAGVIIGLYFAFRSTTPASCDTFTTQSKCPDRCTWKDDTCSTPCSTYTTQSKCPDRCTWKDDSCVTSKAPPPKPTKHHHQTKHHHPPGPKYCGMKCTKSTDCPGGCDQCLKGICNTSQSVPCDSSVCTAGYKLIPGHYVPIIPPVVLLILVVKKLHQLPNRRNPKPTKPGSSEMFRQP